MADPTAWVRWYIASFAPQIGPDDDYRIFGGLWLSHLRMVLDRLDAREREYQELRAALHHATGEPEPDEAIALIESFGCDGICTFPAILAEYKAGDAELTARAEQAEREREWHPIATAPRDGTHILACDWSRADARTTFNQRPPTVVHYWGNPSEDGYYTSVNERAPEHTFNATHWMPLPAPPISSSRWSADHATPSTPPSETRHE